MLILEVEAHQNSFDEVTLCGEKKGKSVQEYFSPFFPLINEIVGFVAADPSRK